MKKTMTFLTLIIICFLITGCNKTDKIKTIQVSDPNAGYRIEQDSEKYYIVLEENFQQNSDIGDVMNSIKKPSLRFNSVEEMRSKVLNGKLTEKEKSTMSEFKKDEKGRIHFLNYNDLYNPKLPNGTTVSTTFWEGNCYYFYLKSDTFKSLPFLLVIASYMSLYVKSFSSNSSSLTLFLIFFTERTAKLASLRLSAHFKNASIIQQPINDEPPLETNGNVTPVKGKMSKEPNTFKANWVNIILTVAQEAIA